MHQVLQKDKTILISSVHYTNELDFKSVTGGSLAWLVLFLSGVGVGYRELCQLCGGGDYIIANWSSGLK